MVGVNANLIDLRLFHVADRNILRTLQEEYFGRSLAEWQVGRFAEEIGEAVWQCEAEIAVEQNRGVTTRVPVGEVARRGSMHWRRASAGQDRPRVAQRSGS